MKIIPLTNSKRIVLVSDRDYPRVRKRQWRAVRNPSGIWYARLCQKVTLDMHRFIFNSPTFQLDHRNRNGLDNRRSNLRRATGSQNGANRKTPRNNTSGAKGVIRCKGLWRAQIGVGRRWFNLGYFKKKPQAVRAYFQAAKQHFGEFARA